MKKRFVFLTLFLFAFFADCFADVYVFDVGKEKGKVPSYEKNGALFVDAQALAKKLGGDTAMLSQSKQLRVKIGSFSSFITAGQKEILINGARASLPAEAEISGSEIFVPIDLFTDQKLADALNRRIIYSDGKYTLEDFFNIEYMGEENGDGYTKLIFRPQNEIKFTAAQKNRGVVEAVLENSILRRQGEERINNGLVTKFNANKCGANQCVRFLMTMSAKSWKFEEDNGDLVFKAFSSASAADGDTPETAPAPSVPAPARPARQIPPSAVTRPADNTADASEDEGEVLSSSAFFDNTKSPVAGAAVNPTNSDPAAAPINVKPKNAKMRIVVDPGHGGKDPGAVRKASAREKDINLEIARELYAALKRRGFDVKMTRDSDIFIPLNQRSKTANDFNADLFVSIHVNAAPRKTAQGLEVYFRSEKATDAQAAETAAFENEALQYEETHFDFADMLLHSLAVNENINESSKVAGHVRNSIKSTSGTGIVVNPGGSVKQANFYVLKGVDAPAILIESGYMSNPSDKRQLNNKNVRAKLADGIYRGILSYAKAEGWQ